MKSGDLLIQKYNPHHDARGRFTTAGSATFVSTKIKRAGGGETFHDVGAKFREAYAKEVQAKQTSVRSPSVLFPLRDAPDLGIPVKHQGSIVVFERKGKFERIDESGPSIHGSHLLGHEGKKGQHYHYRPATEQEKGELATGNLTQRLPKLETGRKETPEQTEQALEGYQQQLAERKAKQEKTRAAKEAQQYSEKQQAYAEQSKQSRQATKAQGLKALTGTAKQKQWAETIRAEKLKGLPAQDIEAIAAGRAHFHSAKYWIENKHLSGAEIATLARLTG